MNDRKEARQTFLKTERLDLILLKVEDANTICKWFNNYEVARFLGRGTYPMTTSFEESYLEKLYQNKDHFQLGIWHRQDQKLIGTTGIHGISNVHLSGEFGITIGEPEYWSNGYGTEALEAMLDWSFNVRGLRVVTLHVLGNNERAKRIYKKAGFVFAGRIPQALFKKGEWVDDEIMYIMNPDVK